MNLRRKRTVRQEARETAAPPRRGRLQVLLAAACALGVFAGVRVQKSNAETARTLTEQALAGTWELRALDGTAIGPNSPTALLSQRLTFQNGRLHGETRLRADSEAATLTMPFPDSSVDAVTPSPDGYLVTVRWSGSYKPVRANLVALKVGKAGYRVKITPLPGTRALELDHDAILTYKGAARYVSVSPQTAFSPAR